LPKQKFDDVWKHKQIFTEELLQDLKIDENLVAIFNDLKKLDIKLAVASNSIKKTVYTVLNQLGISNYFDLILSNEDVINPKPHPEIYWKCMSHFGVLPNQTTIFEDSPIGKEAAILSGANLISISRRRDLDLNKINRGISLIRDKSNSSAPWFVDQLNVLIPMAGAGTRFQSAGFTFPKPLIEVENKPMIQSVVENLNISANYIYIVQEEHFRKYNLGYLLNLITPDCRIVRIDGVTEGAACTTLLAKEFIDSDMPLLIANSDQIIEWNSSESLYSFSKEHLDGGIITFESTHPKWSYVRLDENGYVEEVAEKKPISKIATVGIYYWSKGSDYVKYAQKMIDNNIRTNGEFYVAPVFNEAIKDSKKFKTMNIEKMWGIGTPEDLNIYLNRNLKTS
jgi:HAD superfamily hydrolase (TIGR01509 family)